MGIVRPNKAEGATVTREVKTSETIVENTTAETVVFRGELDSNELKVGAIAQIAMFGKYSNDSQNDKFTLRVYFGSKGFDPSAGGGVEVASTTTVNQAATDAPMSVETLGTIYEDGTNGTIRTHTQGTFNNSESDGHGMATADTTVDAEMVVTIQWGAAEVGNTATVVQGYLDQKA